MRKELMNHKKEIAKEFGIVEGHQLYNIEMRAEEHLLKMTEMGVRVDLEKVQQKIDSIGQELESLKEEIYSRTFGMIKEPNSGAQVALYFQSVGYNFPRTAKGNPQVNQETLPEVDVNPELAEKILEYRKILSSYSQLNSISKVIDDNGRVHPEYLSTKCATGRIYTKTPNIQGWGDDAKSLIIPDDGYKLMVADYKAEELRILASLTKCTKLIQAFKDDVDVHSLTYSMMMSIPYEEVTAEQRAIGKVLNFATIYGQTPEGLARKLKISVERASELQNLYFETYPEIKQWLTKTIVESHRTGYSSTPWGRKRKISFSYDVSKGERQATNTPIQGAGADVIKLALSRSMNDSDEVRVLTTIHDSLVVEYREDVEPERVANWLRKCMEITLGEITLEIDIK